MGAERAIVGGLAKRLAKISVKALKREVFILENMNKPLEDISKVFACQKK